MEIRKLLNFMVVADKILNLDLVREVEVSDKGASFIFSESHRVDLADPAASEALTQLAIICADKEGIERLNRQSWKSGD